MEKRMMQIDAHTGEIQDGFVAYISPKRNNGFTKGWLAMSQPNGNLKLAHANISGQAHRVLHMLLANVDYENHISRPQSEMASELGLPSSNFSRAVTELVTEGVIERGAKSGRVTALKLNPFYGWKGSAKNHVIALDAIRKEKKKTQ